MPNGFGDDEHNRIWEAVRMLDERITTRLNKLSDQITNDLLHKIDQQHRLLMALTCAILGIIGSFVGWIIKKSL